MTTSKDLENTAKSTAKRLLPDAIKVGVGLLLGVVLGLAIAL